MNPEKCPGRAPQGRKEEKIKIARNMKLSGIDTNTIAKVTNLSEDEIDKL